MTEERIPPKQLQSTLQMHAASTAEPAPVATPDTDPATGNVALERVVSDLIATGANAGLVRPESLPVLSAFKDFLEEERRETTRRVRRITGTFVMVTLLLIAGTAITATLVVRGLKGDVGSLKGEIRSVAEESRDIRTSASSALSQVNTISERVAANLTQQGKELGAVRSELLGQVGNQGSELQRLRGVVELLRSSNLTLSQEITEVNQRWPGLADDLKLAMAEIEQLRTATASRPSGQAPRPALPDSLALSIRVPGQREPVQWRLAIPE